MTVFLLIAIPVAVITGSVFVVKRLISFRRHIQVRFGYKLFRIWHFLAILFAALFIFLGNWVCSAFDPASHGFNGPVLIVLGAGLLNFLFFQNCRKTNLFYGLAGTAFAVAVSLALSSFILLCLPVSILGTFQFLTAKRVYVVNRNW